MLETIASVIGIVSGLITISSAIRSAINNLK